MSNNHDPSKWLEEQHIVRNLTCANRLEWQTCTIQLDFQNPISFDLEYMTGDVPVAGAEKTEAPSKVKAKNPQAVADSAEAAGEKAKEDPKDIRKKFQRPLTAGCARPVMIHRAMAGSIVSARHCTIDSAASSLITAF